MCQQRQVALERSSRTKQRPRGGMSKSPSVPWKAQGGISAPGPGSKVTPEWVDWTCCVWETACVSVKIIPLPARNNLCTFLLIFDYSNLKILTKICISQASKRFFLLFHFIRNCKLQHKWIIKQISKLKYLFSLNACIVTTKSQTFVSYTMVFSEVLQ